MSGSPGFAELEKARKPQKGKRGHGAATFRFLLGVRRAAAGAQTPRHRPHRCWKDPTGHEPGWGTKLRCQSPDGPPKQAALKQHQRAAGSDLLCNSPRSIPASGGTGCGAALWTDSRARLRHRGTDTPSHRRCCWQETTARRQIPA